MRTLLLLLLSCVALVLPTATARGQSLYEYRVWFDEDDANAQTGTSLDSLCHIEADVSTLSERLHVMSVQVKNTSGVWSAPVRHYFFKAPVGNDLICRYWLDTETAASTLPYSGHAEQIDVSTLDDGPHILYWQVGHGTALSNFRAQYFLKVPLSGAIVNRYWLDDKSEIRTLPYSGESALIDISDLDDGLHTLHWQVENGNTPSSIRSQMFIKVPQVIGVDHMTCICFVDNKEFYREDVPTSQGVLQFSLQVDTLAQGIHSLKALCVTPSGVASTLAETYFLRTTTTAEYSSMKCLYSIDHGEGITQAGTYQSGAYHFDLDVESLTDGLHTLAYMLVGDGGTTTRINTTFFVKTPIGGQGITSYTYWLNNGNTTAKTVTLDKRVDQLSIVSLIPVESQSIRSSCFQFEVTDGTPTLYAKNDFHLRVYDAAGRTAEQTAHYVDYATSTQVTNIAKLDERQSVTRPSENGIKWYQLTTEIGDSIALKSDQACTLQIFSASGEEVYSASGATSTDWGGCHAFEGGTYYVALHDVTGSGQSLTLQSQHIQKYVVLNYSPNEVGLAPGMVYMDLFGNGFDKLAGAELMLGDLSVAADTYMNEGYAQAQLCFPISAEDLELGSYDLVLHFRDEVESGVFEEEELTVPEALSLVEPEYGDIEISYKDLGKMAQPYPVAICCRNTGNVPYYMIPFSFGYKENGDIQKVEFSNFTIDIPEEHAAAGARVFIETDNIFGTEEYGWFAKTFILYIGPGETQEYQLAITAPGHTKFQLYSRVGKPWSLQTDDMAKAAPARRAAKKTEYSSACEPEKCDLISKMATDSYFCVYSNVLNNRDGLNKYIQDKKSNKERVMPYSSTIRDLVEPCGGDQTLAEMLQALDDMDREYNASGLCNNNPYYGESLTPGDPNDIFGYRAESGSKALRQGIDQVSFDIEFENAPELATAAAHTILVSDTLDSRYFDLSTFAPTGIRLGDDVLQLDGEWEFVKTLDLRPRINVIAEISQSYDEVQGIAQWTIKSLDPMTMEPTDEPMDGVLPINSNGEGQGYISYDIRLTSDQFPDGTEIPNRASIIFDLEDAILTPTWVNTVDAEAPQGYIVGGEQRGDSILTLRFGGTDNRSGVYAFDLYVQAGTGSSWVKEPSTIADTVYNYVTLPGISYGFCVLATDSAGNVEAKELAREFEIETFKVGDANNDGTIDAADVVYIISVFLNRKTVYNFGASNVVADDVIDSQDVVGIIHLYLTSEEKKAILQKRTMRRRI